jgi:hypothetical protein
MPRPVLAMPMWEGAGNRAIDLSGQGNHGTLTNGPKWVSNGLDFDGDNDYIDMGSIPAGHPLNLAGSDVTICLRVNWDGTGDTFQRIVDKADGGTAAHGYSVYNSGPNLVFAVDGGNSILTNSSDLIANTWQDIVLIHRNNSVLGQVFVDGIESTYASRSVKIIPSNTTNMKIGSWYSTGREYNGSICNITMFNVALSETQIKFLYDNPYFMYQMPEELYGYAVVVGAASPTAVFYGPLVGPLGGPL